ncbi:hypothetical protein SOCEGT47_002920 [Sorangium cellulosum]|uniref:Uncharacterized protein n=1 Tax=Sorangium cellulosum TaxID=56 RepID=A0A4P2PT90_SORCE|nr:hypothetical protein SOCEGT47_002920 [Sorangium cellulosum]
MSIAEGSGNPERDTRQFDAIARGSALECAAILDAFEVLGLAAGQELVEPREPLEKTGSMLTKRALAEVNRGK